MGMLTQLPAQGPLPSIHKDLAETLAFVSGCPRFPWSAAGAHGNEASPLYLTCYSGKMLHSHRRHTSLIGSSFLCINYPVAGKKTKSWPEIGTIECVSIYVLCQATGFPYISTRLHCFRKNLKKISIIHYLWWSIEPKPGQCIYNHTSILMKNSTDQRKAWIISHWFML